MSPTLAEFALAIILVVILIRIGLALAPEVLRGIRSMRNTIDEIDTEATTDDSQDDEGRHEAS